MSQLRELYQQVILDHNKTPRNYHGMADATRTVEGYNPLCGDHYTVYVKLEDGTIADVSFEGAGCAISKASASVMSSTVKGKTVEEAQRLFEEFHKLVTTGGGDEDVDPSRLGKLAAFAGVNEFPARVKCAILPWHALRSAITEGDATVAIE